MLRFLFLILLSIFTLSSNAQSKKARKKLMEARTLVSEYKYQDALEEIDDALNDAPEFVDAWLFKADILNRLGKPEEALECYVKAQTYDPPYFLNLFPGRTLYNCL